MWLFSRFNIFYSLKKSHMVQSCSEHHFLIYFFLNQNMLVYVAKLLVDVNVVTSVCCVGAKHHHDSLLVGPVPGWGVQVGTGPYW